MMLTHMARLIAILLSVAAGVISVIGMGAIFSGEYWIVVAITSLLEATKVIAATWLHAYWEEISRKLKLYLSLAVVVLMAITSIGIYGFLSRAHIKQQVAFETGEVSKLPGLKARINIERERIADYEKQINQIDTALTAMTEKGKSRDAKKAIDEANKQRQTRNGFLEEKAKALDRIGELEAEKTKVEAQVKSYEVEVGPLKYVAALYYGSNATTEQLENAVRVLILLLVFVFDPLAIALLIASNAIVGRSKAEEEVDIIDCDTDFDEPVKKKIEKRNLTPRKGPNKSRKMTNPTKVSIGPLVPKRPRRKRSNTLDLSNLTLG